MAHLLACLAAGLFLTNAVPHFVRGVMGMPFQTPFAKPPAKGLSSAVVNVLWGFANLVLAYLLTFRIETLDLRNGMDALAFGIGLLVSGLFLARQFGPLHGGDLAGGPPR